MSLHLSRLSVTGNVTLNTPKCVLLEIAQAHGIETKGDVSIISLLDAIKRKQYPTINTDKNTNKDWEIIARFVNASIIWNKISLVTAYEFLLKFTDTDDPLKFIDHQFDIGLQTPLKPYTLNACVLYKICNKYGITFSISTTIEEMGMAVKMLFCDCDTLIERLQQFLQSSYVKKTHIINMVLSIQNKEEQNFKITTLNKDKEINIDKLPKVSNYNKELYEIYNDLVKVELLQMRMVPTLDYGAIGLAAINYSLDISYSQCPLKEYKELHACGINNYKPVDEWLRYWMKENPEIFDMRVTYNPKIPFEYYGRDRLIDIAKREGCTEYDITRTHLHELLQTVYVSNTFYNGPVPNLREKLSTVYLDNIKDIPPGEIICYGCKSDDIMFLLSVDELIDTFNINKNFIDPFNIGRNFTERAIEKLINILRGSNYGCIQLSVSTITKRTILIDILLNLKLVTKTTDPKTKNFLNVYHNSLPETKKMINKALLDLLNFGMYMRGWSGLNDTYELNGYTTLTEDIIFLNVTNSINEYEQTCKSLGKIGEHINNLPLVKYCDNNYISSTDTREGLTIVDRINIVKGGDTSKNINSCIRLSSNWIVSSAYKYMTLLGNKLSFDIYKLRYIS